MLSDRTITSLCQIDSMIFDPMLFECRKFDELTRWRDAGILPPSDALLEWRRESYRMRTQEEFDAFQPMIHPFSAELIRSVLCDDDTDAGMRKIISRGLTSYGYDVSLDDNFKVFSNIYSAVIDPKRLDPKCLVDVDVIVDPLTRDRYVLMPPNSYLLGHTKEYFRIPRDVQVVCVGKSTYARAGAIVNVTPIEAGFEGNVVIEISNSTNLPARVYAGEGISQFMFFRGDEPCDVSYEDRAGKYQGQTGLTLPTV